MSRKSKTLIIILGVLVLLGGGYYGSTIWKKKKAAPDSAPYTPPAELGNLDSSELVRIEGPGITVEKKDGAWELSYLESGIPPGGIELDQSQVMYMTFSLAKVWAESIVEEEPKDLSVYGLGSSASRTSVTDSSGRKVTYLLGDMTPSRTNYYMMEEGDPKVYSVSAYAAKYMRFFLDSIRNKILFPAFDLQELTRLKIELPNTKIELVTAETSEELKYSSPFSTFLMISPYKIPRGVNNENLNKLLAPLNNLTVVDFIDNPSSPAQYGLDKPVRLFLQAGENALDLLIGSGLDGKHYAKLANPPAGSGTIFTLNNMDAIVNAKAFDLLDRFVFLVNIDSVDHLTIKGAGKTFKADFQKSGDDPVFIMNGRKTETASFRIFYQSVIGLLADADYSAAVGLRQGATGEAETGNVSIVYELNTPPGEKVSITLIPQNRDFYAAEQEGAMDFLISRNQVRKIFETADTIKYED